MITIRSRGDFSKTFKYLAELPKSVEKSPLDAYGQKGVEALRDATPKDTGNTANSWSYEIIKTDTSVKIVWSNNNRPDGALVAAMIQYGHATINGGWVEGIDYINPALKPIFQEIVQSVEKEVRKT